jgi:hypothetical protein
MKPLQLTVLAHEGPQARAYLARIKRAGWLPQRIVLMVQTTHPATRKPVGRWLPRGLRLAYAEKTQEMAANHWPRHIASAQPALVKAIASGLDGTVAEPAALIAEVVGRFSYEDYADRVDRVLVHNLSDQGLEPVLAAGSGGAVLFTGGGILRNNLLGLPGVRFLHVHPGHLPHVRGADGLLWSLLVRGRPGISCFYMASGIDTGEVVVAKDLDELRFDLSGHDRPDDQLLYRALFSFVDPLIRAELLVEEVLAHHQDLTAIPAMEQDTTQGLTYHFLHPALRKKGLELLFVG